MPMTIRIRASVSKHLMGSTVLSKILSCESVMSGAFFPQPNPDVPQEKVSEHAGEDVVIPGWILSHLRVVHSELSLGFLKDLLDGPTNPAQTNEAVESGAHRGIADKVPAALPIEASLQGEPHRPGRLPHLCSG